MGLSRCIMRVSTATHDASVKPRTLRATTAYVHEVPESYHVVPTLEMKNHREGWVRVPQPRPEQKPPFEGGLGGRTLNPKSL